MTTVLLTGASGQIGSRVCPLLRAAGHQVVAVDREADSLQGVERCDLRDRDQIARLFDSLPIRSVVHLAAVLPTACRADPLAAIDVNLTGTLEVLRHAVEHGVRRFVFGSSLSVYRGYASSRALTEIDPAVPDEPYGAAKRAVELVGEGVATASFGFVALRIARVIGPGVRSPTSRWRSEICDAAATPAGRSIVLPFASTARLCLTHVDEVARMLQVLVEAPELPWPVYNGPAEVWEARQLARLVEDVTGRQVQLGEAPGGPVADGARFTQDFDFRLRGLADYLAAAGKSPAA